MAYKNKELLVDENLIPSVLFQNEESSLYLGHAMLVAGGEGDGRTAWCFLKFFSEVAWITSAHIQLAKVSHMAETDIRVVESIIHNKDRKDGEYFE